MDAEPAALPSREAAIFGQILKCYEKTQYRLGLKFCNQILAKPQLAEHGETLALKALALSKLGRRDEARECIRRGLRNNLESHVCWRVYGSLQRADGHYVEAAACVRRALGGCGQEGETRLLEELATLQLLASDLAGFRESQARLLHSLPSVPASWLGYAVACHLLGEPAAALQALQDLLTRHPVMGDARGNQHSELMLYQAELMAEAGMRREALTHLAQYSERICDKQALDEHRGELLLALGCLEEAAELFHGLVMRNPENWTYYQRLEQATHAESEEDRWKIYQHVMKIHPSASAPQRLPLNFLTGTRFRDSMDRFLRQHLSVCCPPLFTTIKGLYRDPDKVLQQSVGAARSGVRHPEKARAALYWRSPAFTTLQRTPGNPVVVNRHLFYLRQQKQQKHHLRITKSPRQVASETGPTIQMCSESCRKMS